ncbi:hypothetical protein [Deinococcus sp. QL22]|uniref:hypothetical protein n=1 Tax=Deinococcus sp. QL22 TaxID=2939437 RepID=UPI002016CA4C|nr:hypothetical protein [Deinococcus sp. QL22]UQN08255.1 hypothetical protein M1R55_16060 [Deinococcus sp. QL22]
MKPAPLTEAERGELTRCEATIRDHRDAVDRIGSALKTIRDQRLYREGFSSFGEYVQEIWNRTRTWAYFLIDAYTTRSILAEVGIPVHSEREARALKPVARQVAALSPLERSKLTPAGALTLMPLPKLMQAQLPPPPPQPPSLPTEATVSLEFTGQGWTGFIWVDGRSTRLPPHATWAEASGAAVLELTRLGLPSHHLRQASAPPTPARLSMDARLLLDLLNKGERVSGRVNWRPA